MEFTSNEELYEAIRDLINILSDSGAEQLSSKLQGALRVSNVTGEVLEEIRFALRCVREHELFKRPEVRRIVLDGIASIDKVL